jgi:secondary thiamine-phosphate synthase enzyme
MFAQTVIKTEAAKQVLNVTEAACGLLPADVSGLAFFHFPHTTTTLLLSEDDEELRADLLQIAARWLKDCGPFRHIRKNNPNTEAHVLSAFGGHGVSVPVREGKMMLGTYQNLLLLELDGPKERELRLCFIPLHQAPVS